MGVNMTISQREALLELRSDLHKELGKTPKVHAMMIGKGFIISALDDALEEHVKKLFSELAYSADLDKAMPEFLTKLAHAVDAHARAYQAIKEP